MIRSAIAVILIVVLWFSGSNGQDARSKNSRDVRGGKRELTPRQVALRKQLDEFVEAGKLTQQEAAELYKTAFPDHAGGGNHMESERARTKEKGNDSLEQRYEQLLKDRPAIRQKIESGRATKEDVLQWLRQGDRRESKRRASKGEYYRKRIEVKDPAEFSKTLEKVVFSGPQPGEKLPPLTVTGIRGDFVGSEYDPVAVAGKKPLVLIFQDNSVVGQKGLLLTGPALARIAEKSPTGLHVSTTFLVDDPTPRAIFKYDFVDQISDVIQMSISSDGRDGPGIYGLNRNVAMTIIVAKDRKVLHNFAFTQPMLYPDPHVMGAIAAAVGVDSETVAGWMNKKSDKNEQVKRQHDKDLATRQADFKERFGELVDVGKLTRDEAIGLYFTAFPADGRGERARK